MEAHLRFIQFGLALAIFIGIMFLMIKKKSNASISLIWIIMAVGAMVLGLFPQITDFFCDILGISYPPSLIFAIIIIALILVLFYISSELATAQTKIRELAMQISLLNNEVKNLKSEKQDESI